MNVEQMAKFILDVVKAKKTAHIPFIVRACDAAGDHQLLGECRRHGGDIVIAEGVSFTFIRAFAMAKSEMAVAYDDSFGGAPSGFYCRLLR